MDGLGRYHPKSTTTIVALFGADSWNRRSAAAVRLNQTKMMVAVMLPVFSFFSFLMIGGLHYTAPRLEPKNGLLFHFVDEMWIRPGQ